MEMEEKNLDLVYLLDRVIYCGYNMDFNTL